jgi:hypothetical protein
VFAPEISQLVTDKVIAIHTPFNEGWEVHLRGKYAFTSCCGGQTAAATWDVIGNDRNVLCFRFRNASPRAVAWCVRPTATWCTAATWRRPVGVVADRHPVMRGQ